MEYYEVEEDKLGLRVTSGSIKITKDTNNLIGISIGGGAPLCPCIYIVQVFDNTPAAKDATLASGDEITAVNGTSVKGKTKVEVARMIQGVSEDVQINYNKLHADPKQGKSLDIVLKKMKHKVVENMSSSTADALGLSRAILCNDGLVKKLEELEGNANMFMGLVIHVKKLLNNFYSLSRVHKAFGEVFAAIGVREPLANASEAFTKFGETHREMEKYAIKMLQQIKPIISDMGTFLSKAVPDTRLTIKKYADCKFEYLSYCLKVKEMDDEEYSYAAIHEPLYRVETGNYEYRLVLRCRQLSREKFAKMRSDVLVKMELLDQKHVQDSVYQMQRFITALKDYHEECATILKTADDLFPIEVDLSTTMLGLSVTDGTRAFYDDEDNVNENVFSTRHDNADLINDNSSLDSNAKDANLIDWKLESDQPIIDLG